ncbi:MAG: hypothetical protein R3D03_15585 [Geminicoccaceae bacterium]
MIEWTHWKTAIGEVLRGDEWYAFNEDITGREIRAYCASPVDRTMARLHGFDYEGRGYHMAPPELPERNGPTLPGDD